MEFFDLFFWSIGRVIQKCCRHFGFAKFELSDGSYWTLGFFFTFLVCLSSFIIWGVFYV